MSAQLLQVVLEIKIFIFKKALKVSKQNLATLNAKRCIAKYSNSELTLEVLYIFHINRAKLLYGS